MFLLQANAGENGAFRLLGYMIGLTLSALIFGVISKLSIKLAVRIIAKKSIAIKKPFWISFVSIMIAFIIGELLRGSSASSSSSLLDVFPEVLFFISCWILIARYISFGEEENSQSYFKAFLTTLLQTLFLVTIAFVSAHGIMLFSYWKTVNL